MASSTRLCSSSSMRQRTSPPLRDLDQIASTAAGLGIQLVTIWQDRAQIVARYGQRAATVVNNHRAKLLLSGITDVGTTGDFSQVIGDTEIHRQSTTFDAEGRMSATHAEHVRPLASSAVPVSYTHLTLPTIYSV